jgi:hypothetical protein
MPLCCWLHPKTKSFDDVVTNFEKTCEKIGEKKMYNILKRSVNILLRKDKFLFGHCILMEDVTCVATNEAITNVCSFIINNFILFHNFS